MKRYKNDYYAQKAQNENFVARSIYKLEEINARFHVFSHLIKQAQTVRILDLGAAPGSWTQYILRTMSKCVQLVSVDLQELSKSVITDSMSELTVIQGSFTDAHIQSEIYRLGPYHCILSDAAPRTTGNKTVDISASQGLVESVFRIAKTSLVRSGTMVAKIFQGSEEKILIQKMKSHFKTVHLYRPQCVKKHSFEHYVVCR